MTARELSVLRSMATDRLAVPHYTAPQTCVRLQVLGYARRVEYRGSKTGHGWIITGKGLNAYEQEVARS